MMLVGRKKEVIIMGRNFGIKTLEEQIKEVTGLSVKTLDYLIDRDSKEDIKYVLNGKYLLSREWICSLTDADDYIIFDDDSRINFNLEHKIPMKYVTNVTAASNKMDAELEQLAHAARITSSLNKFRLFCSGAEVEVRGTEESNLYFVEGGEKIELHSKRGFEILNMLEKQGLFDKDLELIEEFVLTYEDEFFKPIPQEERDSVFARCARFGEYYMETLTSYSLDLVD